MSNAEAQHGRVLGGADRTTDPMTEFLLARLSEDMTLLWEREEAREGVSDRPSLGAQIAILDELMARLRSGLLPPRAELRMLLYGYGSHRDYDPAWACR
jgi:hypothetical protein